ncbi:MAG TPA: hypothetical protein DEG17_24100 [Cyanobacteria bacterium UBA11149]|nr:hypothetical protein [Cyanobacteria bacterium UBA11367]HBE60637.1 hypothetical protein [Cyanobacteria bacterium UBA11366]HBK63986.1 hypothetical protein [Cyanobacteria bacterium UBA11166]HBR73913.1 hypothetical protein [Cyanobacteria bacterium UBA11159]HBS72471.1 hypothetical protein [Cyanobacteria bacterium UBA11153]HBW91864.1 hypothetical protein [Cyanobacteria bacterium UBA11149]HCA96862.1 hypothetical protein [Cyanobacteria bacterium UBA9226]
MYKPRKKNPDRGVTVIKSLVATILILGLVGSIQSCGELPCSDKTCIKKKIAEGKTVLSSLRYRRNYELKSLYDEYDRDYREYYEKLRNQLQASSINKHEDLLRQCEKYIETCNLLERVAILRYSMNWLDEKIANIDLQIGKLDQNIWKLNKKIELSAIASREEQDKVNQLIVSTKVILEEQITPPEAQDTAKLQQEIFDQVVNSYLSP